MQQQLSSPVKAALNQLQTERDKLQQQIYAIENAISALDGNSVTGSPVSNAGPSPRTKRSRKGRKPMTAAQKKAISARMKAVWAARRKRGR